MSSEIVPVKERDFLEQDPPIRGQKFVCLSFISPEDVIRKKDIFFFNKFLKHFSNDVGELLGNLTEKFANDNIVNDMISTIKQRYDYIFNESSLHEEYEFFKQKEGDALDSEYFEKNNFQTTIRGIKVRGTYDTIVEAKSRAEQLKKIDKNFNVYIAEVGCWCPWSPSPELISDQEYSETQLNTLMKKYKEGQEIKDELYRLRRDDLIEKVKMHNNDPTNVKVEDAGPSIVEVRHDADHNENDNQQDSTNGNLMTDKDVWMNNKE